MVCPDMQKMSYYSWLCTEKSECCRGRSKTSNKLALRYISIPEFWIKYFNNSVTQLPFNSKSQMFSAIVIAAIDINILFSLLLIFILEKLESSSEVLFHLFL